MSDETMRSADTWEGPRNEGPGGRIGPFTILKRIGEGGFGVVFEAEQDEPIKRRVALKVVKLGMDTEEVIARFEAERQALAMMDHPHIAHVLDAGATESGRPYFVMELVDGEPISSYCDRHTLSIVERLQLFDQVCTAVQHAHTKGIIHRDLKPNNVLVSTQDGQPFAKVIDFGIAKATSGRLTERTLQTELNQIMGTPLYMSPEQAEGNADIDTRTDVYSLGVMLYELLTGTTPVQSESLRSAVFAEVQRIICKVDPPSPSARLSQTTTTMSGIATQRATDARKLTRMVEGELDWIVMKALEKERGRRYETANGLAMDIKRYLAAEPVLAAPPSASYRLQKFVRRHKGVVAAGSLIAASLLAGIVGFAWQARIAQARANELAQVADFQATMLRSAETDESGRKLTDDVHSMLAASMSASGMPAAESNQQLKLFDEQWRRINSADAARNVIDFTILQPSVDGIDRKFKSQPLVAATLRTALGASYQGLGMYDAALPLYRQALLARRRVLGSDDPATLDSVNTMCVLSLHQGKLGDAENYCTEALSGRRRVLGPEHPDTLTSLGNLGLLKLTQDKLDEAEPLLREQLDASRRVLGPNHEDTISAVDSFANLMQARGKLADAEPYYREALVKRRRTSGENDPDTLRSLNNLGVNLYLQGKAAQAEPYLRAVLEKYRQVLGENHPSTIQALNNLGSLLQGQGKLDQAEPLLHESLEKYRLLYGNEHPETLTAINNMGMLLQAEGKLDQAEPLQREALATSRRVLGEEHAQTVHFLINLGGLLMAQRKISEAEPLFREAFATSHRTSGDENPDALIAAKFIGSVLVDQGKYAEAEKQLAPFEAATRATFTGSNARRVGAFLMNLGKARAGLGKFTAAETALLEAQPILLETRGPKHPETRECTQAIIDLYTAWNAKEPHKGYDAKAAEWKRQLSELDAPATATG